MHALSEARAKPAIPFGGRHRLIDFTLANCANSGLEQVTVLARHNWRSIHEALTVAPVPGEPGRLPSDVRLSVGHGGAYAGSAGAMRRTLRARSPIDGASLVLSADHVYSMDYRRLLGLHRQRGADLTIAVTRVTLGEATRLGVVEVDAEGRIRAFTEKPSAPRSTLASMGVYAFDDGALRWLLEEDAANPASSHDFGHDVIPLALRWGMNVYAYEFDGYWRDVGTVESYWAASMDFARGSGPARGIDWPPVPRPEFCGQARIGARAVIEGALLAGECEIEGHVRGSVVFAGARVEPGATVVDSVLLPGAVVGRNAVVRRAIIDERASVGTGASVGTRAGEIFVLPAPRIALDLRDASMSAPLPGAA